MTTKAKTCDLPAGWIMKVVTKGDEYTFQNIPRQYDRTKVILYLPRTKDGVEFPKKVFEAMLLHFKDSEVIEKLQDWTSQ